MSIQDDLLKIERGSWNGGADFSADTLTPFRFSASVSGEVFRWRMADHSHEHAMWRVRSASAVQGARSSGEVGPRAAGDVRGSEDGEGSWTDGARGL
jgi:hypothetical protein